MNTYTVNAYNLHAKVQNWTLEVTAITALEALQIAAGRPGTTSRFASVTSRWGASPDEADRDNCHGQANSAGTIGWAVVRKEVDEEAANHRHEVQICRRWLAEGRTLESLQSYGAYKGVTAEEAALPPEPYKKPTDALGAAGFKVYS